MFRQLLIVVSVFGLALSASQIKISPELQQLFLSRPEAKVNIFIYMKEGNDEILSRLNTIRFSSRAAKITAMRTQLEQLAETSQAGIRNLLEAHNIKYNSFWISNRVFVPEATLELVEKLAQDARVAEIKMEEMFHVADFIPDDTNNTINAEWGIEKIEAEQAWNLPGGNSGQGVVVASIDTGVRYTHQALSTGYRNDGYGWYDPYSRAANPEDQSGHGTHTMGIIAGGNGIGVAPGVQWISCRGCLVSSCSQASLESCGQWVTCPTRSDGSLPDCSKAPQVTFHGWASGQGSTSYEAVVNAWHTAGIIPVFTNGNSGASCGTANSPGDLEKVIGVGSTDPSDTILSLSSRGPAVAGHIKPDISAPGSNIHSAFRTSDTAYSTISGSSMAAAHVAGSVALLIGRDPNLTFEQVQTLLFENTDVNVGNAAECGGTPHDQFPNNIYGFGRLNARKSLEALINDQCRRLHNAYYY